MVRFLVSSAVVLMLAGCATAGTQYSKVDQATVDSFKPGETTVAQVEAALGQPFQSNRLPDGSEQLQYISKVRDLAVDDTPTTGSAIPKKVDKVVSTMLSFDKSGHFVRSWSTAKAGVDKWPSDLGRMQGTDIERGPTHQQQ
ncbi:hypothetical protein SAMN05216570_1634 [Dyella sp. OK004]|uniref:hypothetical protein n=1 Tax=Dyella sp. OK004 TaxID=1855292 RepID=UPI0008E86DF7|nr:hypothetical protein [Dyella sp. OK004]SFS02587.1 hypothetical protein SAMN05216570_1634 [Dyella sp. OK004]